MFFILISYYFLVLSYLMMQVQNIQLVKMNEISLCISIIVLGFYYIKEKIEFFPNKRAKNIFFYMIFIFVVYQLLNTNEFYVHDTRRECIMNLLVIINIYLYSGYIYYRKCEDIFILITYLSLAIFICIIYIYNFDNFEGLKQISTVFNNADRYRNSYGLYHPNGTGLMCYLALVLSFYLYKCSSYKKTIFRAVMFSFNIVISIVIISTSSRTAITSIFLFLIIFSFMKIKSNFNVNKYISVFIKFIMLSVCIIILIKVLNLIAGIDFIELFTETNRISNFTMNIPILVMNHKELFGMGYYKIFIDMYNGTYIDNWYLYMFLTSGIIGLILSILLIAKVYIYISKNNSSSLLEIFTISYFFSQLYYSLFETEFFQSGILNTFIFWIFIFTTIYNKNQKITLGELDKKIYKYI